MVAFGPDCDLHHETNRRPHPSHGRRAFGYAGARVGVRLVEPVTVESTTVMSAFCLLGVRPVSGIRRPVLLLTDITTRGATRR